MKIGKLVLLGAAGFFAWNFFNKQSSVNYNIIGVKLIPPSIVLDIYNPTDGPLTLNSVLADITYNGNRIGILNSFGNIIIPPLSKKAVTIAVDGDAFGFVGVLQNIIAKGVKGVRIEVNGRMTVNNISLPLNSGFQIV